MTFNLTPAHWPTNAAPSSYAIIAAQNAGGGDLGALVHGILRAVWAEERDIAGDDVIRACLAVAGFDPALADSGLLSGAETYAANLEEAVSRGVFGSPFYITDDGAPFWGQDRLEDLDAHLADRAA
jgi:2-hydroxychromene-2-carboxylate isomerase